MPKLDDQEHSLPAQLRTLPAAVRAIVQAARRAVKAAAPDAVEVGCQMKQPRSKSMMWKLCRYGMGGEDGYVVAIGVFTEHASVFFSRGAELEDGSGILEGSGKQLRRRSSRPLRRPSCRGRSRAPCTPTRSFHPWTSSTP